MNMWGCDLTTSELLGYNVNKEHSSALNYTRDCLSGPMRDMIAVMRQINLGIFKPAAPRDQVFPQPLQRKPIARHFLEVTGLNVMEAASVIQESAVFATSEAMRQAVLRLSSPKPEHNFPMGMVDFLSEDEEMALRRMPGAVGEISEVESASSSASSDSEDEEECELSHSLIDDVHNEGRRAIPSSCSGTMLAYRHNRTKMVTC